VLVVRLVLQCVLVCLRQLALRYSLFRFCMYLFKHGGKVGVRKRIKGLVAWRTFWSLTRHQKQLFGVSFILSGIARACILLFKYHRLAFYYGHFHRMTVASTVISLEQQQLAWKIRRAIDLATKYTPWHSNCLTKALVAKFWCQYYRIPYMLFIGLAKKSDKPLGSEGHAWLVAGPVAISGGYNWDSHQVILSYSSLSFHHTTSV